MRKFSACVIKNFKNVFRNLTSVFLIVIGPLLLLGLIFAAFSNVGFNNINLGYVTNAPDEVDSFLNSIEYVGNFIEYNSIERCNLDLKQQNLHACLDIHSNGEKTITTMHADNTRTLITYILFSQIRQAVFQEREVIIAENVRESIGEARDATTFLEDAQYSVEQTMTELEKQQREVVEVQSELSSIYFKVDSKQNRLREIRTDLQQKRTFIGARSDDIYFDSLNSLNLVESSVDDIYDAISPVQNEITVPSEFIVLNQISSARNELNANYNIINNELSEIDDIIIEIDQTIVELEETKRFIEDVDDKLDDLHDEMNRKNQELFTLNNRVKTFRTRFDSMSSANPELFAAPLDVSLVPLFTGSKRILDLDIKPELTQEQKVRLLNFGSIQTLIPFVLSIMICFISIILGNILVLDEIHSPAFIRNLIAPVSDFTKTIALFVTVVIITGVQVGIVLFLSSFIFLLDIYSNPIDILVPLVLLVSIYTIVGMIIGYLVKNQSTALLVSSFVLITNLFMSGAIYPVERMAPFMEGIAQIIPFTSGISMLQQGIFYGVPLSVMMDQLMALILIFLGSIAFLFVAKKWFLRRSLRSFD